jgi:hypothetical protein
MDAFRLSILTHSIKQNGLAYPAKPNENHAFCWLSQTGAGQ